MGTDAGAGPETTDASRQQLSRRRAIAASSRSYEGHGERGGQKTIDVR